MNLEQIATPALVVDLQRFQGNCDRMRRKAAASGVRFRPHVKTHKTVEGALIQHGGTPGPITVSTLAEAEFFAAAGFEDITYAVPIDGGKLSRAADLAQRIQLHLLIDTPEALEQLEVFGRRRGVRFSVFLKVDSGGRRAGVDPAAPESVDLARRMARSDAVETAGLLTHAGHSYHARTREEIVAVANEEAEILTRFRGSVGVPNMFRSVGSTPTASVVDRFPDTDEVRPGNYVFFDAFQATLGSCTPGECAATVLVTVISTHPRAEKLIVDGGALAFSKDTGPTHLDPGFGYGIVCDSTLRPLPLRFAAMSQEHGQIVGTDGIDFAAHPVGSKLRIVPNHSCLTAAMFARYWIVRGDSVVDQWAPVRGW